MALEYLEVVRPKFKSMMQLIARMQWLLLQVVRFSRVLMVIHTFIIHLPKLEKLLIVLGVRIVVLTSLELIVFFRHEVAGAVYLSSTTHCVGNVAL